MVTVRQNAIDKFKLKVFVPVSAFRSPLEDFFIMFLLNKNVLCFILLTICADKAKILK